MLSVDFNMYTIVDLCVDGDVRIQGGQTYGRVDVCVNQTWGTVCSGNHWNDVAASVVCRQLGHSSYGRYSILIMKYMGTTLL